MSDRPPRRRPLRYRGIDVPERWLRRWRVVLAASVFLILLAFGIGQAVSRAGDDVVWPTVLVGGAVWAVAVWVILTSLHRMVMRDERRDR